MSRSDPSSSIDADSAGESDRRGTSEEGSGARGSVSAPAEITRGSSLILLTSVFVIASCSLIYELLAGALSSYLLGSSITHFSLVIGLFLTAMGIGSFISKLFTKNLLQVFMTVEIFVGLIGGTSALLLFTAFALVGTYIPLLITICLFVGALVGLEIPLLIRILRNQASLRSALGNVLAVDYLGALAASLLFPFFLVPRLGMVRSGFLFGILNVLVALVGVHFFRHQIQSATRLRVLALVVIGLLTAGIVAAGKTTSLLEDVLYDDEVIFSKTTPYQRLVITRWRNDLRLFIDGNIQFSSVDEFRYHEALVHPAMGLVREPKTVLLLGAGDGLAAREILKHKTVTRIELVDLDPAMTQIFSRVPMLIELNKGSLKDKRVKIYNEDAQKFLERTDQRYDVIIIDLPDPNNESLGKLYTRSFYRLMAKHLTPCGVMVTQATSPFFATASYWCIVNTINSATISSAGGSLHALPYHASVPSFGDWGFVLASLKPLSHREVRLDVPTRFLTAKLVQTLFVFPKDIGPRKTPINRLDNQILIRLYEKGFRNYNK